MSTKQRQTGTIIFSLPRSASEVADALGEIRQEYGDHYRLMAIGAGPDHPVYLTVTPATVPVAARGSHTLQQLPYWGGWCDDVFALSWSGNAMPTLAQPHAAFEEVAKLHPSLVIDNSGRPADNGLNVILSAS